MAAVSIVLYNLRSAHNVGSIFRTADAAGVRQIYLTGTTPTPRDRFGRARRDMAKVALGAEQSLLWEYYEDIFVLIERLRRGGMHIVAVEQIPSARDYRDFSCLTPTAFLFGNEVDGLPESVCAACDEAIQIPIYGSKESLNVAVAVGVVVFGLCD